MIYVFEILTPANTAVYSKQKTVLQIERGRIYRIEVTFPPGPSGLLHVQICRGIHQIWPTNPNLSFIGDDCTISFEDELDIDEPPFELEVYTWNEDTFYDHTVIIRAGIKSLPISTGLIFGSPGTRPAGGEIEIPFEGGEF